MSREIGRYCTETQMFVETPKVNMGKLIFNRWLVENRRSEHPAEGLPSGEFALALVIISNTPTDKLMDHFAPARPKD